MSNPRPGRSYDRKCCNKSVSKLRDASRDGDIPVQVGTNFVGLGSTESVALRATSLEERGTLASVAYTRHETLDFGRILVGKRRPTCSVRHV